MLGLLPGLTFPTLHTQLLAGFTVVVGYSAQPFHAYEYPATRLVHRRSCLLSRAFITVNTQPCA